MSEDELLKRLIALGKEQGLPYVYVVETISGSLQPRTIERIDVANGKRELVRGAQLADLDLRTLRTGILAAGDEDYVFNIFGDVPSTVIAPPLLLDDVTVKRVAEQNAHLHYIPPPSSE